MTLIGLHGMMRLRIGRAFCREPGSRPIRGVPLLCPDCGAKPTLPNRCTNCGKPLTGTDASAFGADDDDDRSEAAWRWEEDRDDVAWGPSADAARAVPPAAQGWQLWRLRPLGGLAIALYVLLALSMVASLTSVVASLRRASLADDLRNADPFLGDLGGVTLDDLRSADDFVATTAFVSLPLLIATSVVFIIWFFRARKNVELFGLHRPRLGPGWAIGGWVCPVVNLWFPARIASDLWKGSDTSKGAADIGKPFGRVVLILCWWIPLTISSVLDRVVLSLAFDDASLEDEQALDDLIASDRYDAASEGLMVIAGVFAIMLVRRITALQAQRAAHLWALSGPPETWGHPPLPTPSGPPVPAAPQPETPQP